MLGVLHMPEKKCVFPAIFAVFLLRSTSAFAIVPFGPSFSFKNRGFSLAAGLDSFGADRQIRRISRRNGSQATEQNKDCLAHCGEGRHRQEDRCRFFRGASQARRERSQGRRGQVRHSRDRPRCKGSSQSAHWPQSPDRRTDQDQGQDGCPFAPGKGAEGCRSEVDSFSRSGDRHIENPRQPASAGHRGFSLHFQIFRESPTLLSPPPAYSVFTYAITSLICDTSKLSLSPGINWSPFSIQVFNVSSVILLPFTLNVPRLERPFRPGPIFF